MPDLAFSQLTEAILKSSKMQILSYSFDALTLWRAKNMRDQMRVVCIIKLWLLFFVLDRRLHRKLFFGLDQVQVFCMTLCS